MKYRTKPRTVEARQLRFGNAHDVARWVGACTIATRCTYGAPWTTTSVRQGSGDQVPASWTVEEDEFSLEIDTIDGCVRAGYGDWIVKDPARGFIIVPSDVFDASYELLEAS